MDVPIELEGNRERGRGIALTNISCKNLFYNEKGNRASIIWELKKHPGSLPVCKLTEGK